MTMKKFFFFYFSIVGMGLSCRNLGQTININNRTEDKLDTLQGNIQEDSLPCIIGSWYLSCTYINGAMIMGNDNPWIRFLDDGHGEYYAFEASSQYPSLFDWQINDTLLTINGYRRFLEIQKDSIKFSFTFEKNDYLTLKYRNDDGVFIVFYLGRRDQK